MFRHMIHTSIRSHLQLFIHSFIQESIRRPFKKSTQRSPNPATTIQINLREQPAERTFTIFRQEVDFQRESIPGGWSNDGECTTLSSFSFSMSRPMTEERRALRPGRPDTGLQSS